MAELFAVMIDGSINRVKLSTAAAADVEQLFLDAAAEQLSYEEIEFNGGYLTENSEIFTIANFSLSDSIQNALTNAISCPILDKTAVSNIKNLFLSHKKGKVQTVYFQTFDSRKLLTNRFALIASSNDFTRLMEPGLIIDAKVDAVFSENKLSFISYHNARKIFDLQAYYREATDEDLDTFSKLSLFDGVDAAAFQTNADSIIRKTVALILKNKTLDSVDISTVKKIAKSMNIKLKTKKKGNKEFIDMPSDKKELKELIRFLDEDYFFGPLTEKKYRTNSKTNA